MAQRSSRPDAQETGTVRSLRSMGSGTDVLSISTRSSRAALPHARPQPAYVSESEAEQLVYAEIEQPTRISESALSLVNGFLDQILYDILSRSRSVALSALRSAVPIVLKQRLGHSAVSAADEELQDYLDEDEMEEIQSAVAVLDPKAEFDVDLSWKLTRLRCMVYAKLGDMEEEDEEDYLDDDDLKVHIGRAKESVRIGAAITPPAAIFLTSVLEFLGEQALCIAAQHARKRHFSYKLQSAADSMVATQEHDQGVIPLEEIDMSGVGKEGPLIRLWRSWKGSIRSGAGMSSRPTTPIILSPTAPDSPGHDWKFPAVPPISTIQEERSPSIRPADSPLPAEIPLPISDHDVEEIEIPGLAPTFESEDDESPGDRPTLEKRRPSSMLIMPGNFPYSVSPSADQKQDNDRPVWTRRRSQSVPTSPQPASGVQLRQIEKERTPDYSMEGVMNTSSSSEDLGDTVPQYAREDSNCSPRPNRISTTVATIAGALSIEASRGYRRDQPSYLQPATDSDRAALQASPSDHTTDDPDPIAAGQGSHTASTTGGHEGDIDPEDLALSSSDEREVVEEDRSNLRDSGFGVAGSEDELPAHDQATTAPEQGLTTADSIQVDNHNNDSTQEQSASDGTEVDNLGTAAIFYQGTAGSGGHGSPESTSYRQPERPDVSVPTSTANKAGATNSSAWPVVIQGRTSSLESKASAPSPIQRSLPNQVPTRHQAAQERMGHTPQDGAPQYATSPFAAGRDGHDLVQVAQAGITSTGKDGMPSTAGRQHVRLQTDIDDGPRRPSPPDEMDRAKKSLDVLIDSDETLRITLTPKSARAANEKPKVKSQTQELADFFRNTAPPGEEVTRPKSSRSAKGIIDDLRSKPQSSSKIPLPGSIKSSPAQSNLQQPVSSPPRPKNPLGEPRDPRMARSSTRDLADYARSTGPENEAQLPKPLAPRPGTGQETAESEDRLATTSGKPVHRLKYQARDARGPRTAESSELIDFIREGPPRPPGDHRIDRHVAPFRTTMDSDDLNALAPPEMDSKGRSSVGSTHESAITVKSMPSSMNSRTGLLDSTNRMASKFPNGIGNSAHPIPRQPAIPEADGMPKRTRRRVRDPYAIDFSDEEDEMNEPSAPQQRRAEEESLVDFLRNTAPPPGMTTQPILAAVPDPDQPNPSVGVKRSTSSSKLRDYFQGSMSGRNGATMKPSNGARAESPHLTQVGSKMDKYRPTQPTHAAHVERNRQRMRAEPRDPSAANGGDTADLAAYLKNSGPDPGKEIPPQKFNLGGKDHVGFMRFFQKRSSVKRDRTVTSS